MTRALLLVDIQNDYFPGGAMELPGSPAAGAKAGMLLRAFRQKGHPVVHMQHISTRRGATFFLPDTPGCGFMSPWLPPRVKRCFRRTIRTAFAARRFSIICGGTE